MTCETCKKLPWHDGATPRCLCHGFNLDLGSSDHKQKGFIGADKRPLQHVDLVFDIELVPWPIATETVDRLLCSHVLEHMKPWLMNDIMDEMWRVMKRDSQALIVVPHADSYGFRQDPTHCNMLNEATWAYYDPEHPSGLYNVYRPKPWKIARLHWSPLHNIEVVLEPRKATPPRRRRRVP
jgi:hypothetical protein